jgi:hypothetical protein
VLGQRETGGTQRPSIGPVQKLSSRYMVILTSMDADLFRYWSQEIPRLQPLMC